MLYNTLGKTGLKVSRLGFGTMRLPTKGRNDIIDEDEASKMLTYGIENGINLVGFALLMLLMIVVMYNDILKLF